jgi:hypothetical protein
MGRTLFVVVGPGTSLSARATTPLTAATPSAEAMTSLRKNSRLSNFLGSYLFFLGMNRRVSQLHELVHRVYDQYAH